MKDIEELFRLCEVARENELRRLREALAPSEEAEDVGEVVDS